MFSRAMVRFAWRITQVILFICFPAIAQTPTYNANEYLAPFWSTDTMYNESVLMVSPDSISPAEAALLFSPLTILSVKNSALTTEYAENVDWLYNNGKLKLLPGSQAAFMTNSQLYPTTGGSNTMAKKWSGYVLFYEGHFFHDRQLAVTYTHAKNVWAGPIPQFAGNDLPNTTMKLILSEPLKIVFFGNSITVGGNASGNTGAPPYMPRYSDLVVDKLRSTYASLITMTNSAVGGTTSSWGLSNVHSLVTLKNPDLVVLSFGMNDGTGGVVPADFKANVQGMMNDVRATNPNAEFILIATTLANSETFFSGGAPGEPIQAVYEPVLRELVGVGTVLVNMTGVHQELLKHKLFRDMTGNNVNHPNDFLHRWYAQQICGLLIPSSPITGFVKITLLDSLTNRTVTTPSSAELFKSGLLVGGISGPSGTLLLSADSGNDYTVNVASSSYSGKTGFKVGISSGLITPLEVRFARHPLTGIDIKPDTLVMSGNEQRQLCFYDVYSDGAGILNNQNALPIWTSLSPGLISVSDSGLVTSNSLYGKSIVTARVGSLGFSDSVVVMVIRKLRNPSFESPAITGFQYLPLDSAWTFAGGAGIQHNGSAFEAANAPDGVQGAFLQNISSIKQQISLDSGTYQVKFQVARRGSNVQTVKTYLDSTEIGSVTPSSAVFGEFISSSITVPAGSFQLKITGTASTGDNTAFIDNVRMASGLNTDNEPYILSTEKVSLSTSPNPFNPMININMTGVLPRAELKIINVNGKVIANLTSALNAKAGKGACSVAWDATGNASGVYLITLKAGKTELRKKALLVR